MSSKHKQFNTSIIFALVLLALTVVAAIFHQQNYFVTDTIPVVSESAETDTGEAEESKEEQNLADDATVEGVIEETTEDDVQNDMVVQVSPTPPFVEAIRVEPDGAVVLAGRSDPDAEIKILLNEAVVNSSQADTSGNFVALFDIGMSAEIRVMSLLAIVDGKEVYAEEDIIIAASKSAETTLSDETVVAQAEVDVGEQGKASQEPETPSREGSSKDTTVETETEAVEEVAEKTPDTETAQKTNLADHETNSAASGENESTESTVVEITSMGEEINHPVVQTDDVAASNTNSNATDLETDGAVTAKADERKTKEQEEAVSSKKDDGEEETSTQLATTSTEIKDDKTSGEDYADLVVKKDDVSKMPAAEPLKPQNETEPDTNATERQADTEVPSVEDPVEEVKRDEEPLVVIAGKNGVKVVQSSKESIAQDVSVDAISYDETGEVALTGRGNPSQMVRIYLDNMPISTVAMDTTGQWNTALSDINAGIYTLRVDVLDQTGNVVSRLETPFKREKREDLAAYMLQVNEPARINVVTVQPGNTLWAIARERYGQGVLYVRVFEENKDKIRNPDLIYPGQVFSLPDD